MTKSKTFLAALVAAGLSLSAAAQLPPPPPLPPGPPVPVEIRPTIVEVAPPPVRVETRTARPGVGYLWANGYWDWADSWVWVPGRWVTPVARATWVPAEYTRVRSGYRYVPAHWSNQTVVAAERAESAGRGRAVGHVKAKGKGHSKAKGQGHVKYD
jgi:YXWGXW repeat-containing protein